jgi:hypothetical protein
VAAEHDAALGLPLTATAYVLTTEEVHMVKERRHGQETANKFAFVTHTPLLDVGDGSELGGYGIKDFRAAQNQGPKTIQFTCQTPLL